jgi:hypothetical protein
VARPRDGHRYVGAVVFARRLFSAVGAALAVPDRTNPYLLFGGDGLANRSKVTAGSFCNLTIANDPAGNFLCFDYRPSRDNDPTVVFLDHEALDEEHPEVALTYVCRSFAVLLYLLVDCEDISPPPP